LPSLGAFRFIACIEKEVLYDAPDEGEERKCEDGRYDGDIENADDAGRFVSDELSEGHIIILMLTADGERLYGRLDAERYHLRAE